MAPAEFKRSPSRPVGRSDARLKSIAAIKRSRMFGSTNTSRPLSAQYTRELSRSFGQSRRAQTSPALAVSLRRIIFGSSLGMGKKKRKGFPTDSRSNERKTEQCAKQKITSITEYAVMKRGYRGERYYTQGVVQV